MNDGDKPLSFSTEELILAREAEQHEGEAEEETAPDPYGPELEGEISNLFHSFWTDAVGTAGYDKKKWQRLSRLMNEHGVLV